MSTRCHPGAYLDRARRELHSLDAALRHAENVAADADGWDGDVRAGGRPQVLDALAGRRSSAEARLARLVFNGDELRDATAEELEAALGWLRCGLAALGADAAADSASLPATYYAAAEQQVRAWRAAVDLVALQVCDVCEPRGARSADPDPDPGADPEADDAAAVATMATHLAAARRSLRWGPATGSLGSLRREVETHLAEVRGLWAAAAWCGGGSRRPVGRSVEPTVSLGRGG